MSRILSTVSALDVDVDTWSSVAPAVDCVVAILTVVIQCLIQLGFNQFGVGFQAISHDG